MTYKGREKQSTAEIGFSKHEDDGGQRADRLCCIQVGSHEEQHSIWSADAFRRHGSWTPDSRRRSRRIQRARPSTIGIAHVVRAARLPRDVAADARQMAPHDSSNRRQSPGLTNDFVRTRFRLSTHSSERKRATYIARTSSSAKATDRRLRPTDDRPTTSLIPLSVII